MKQTQKDRVLSYIEEFGSISSYQAFVDLGITQLGARIFELKKQGKEFECDWEEKSNRFGDPVRFKRYRIAEPAEPELQF